MNAIDELILKEMDQIDTDDIINMEEDGDCIDMLMIDEEVINEGEENIKLF